MNKIISWLTQLNHEDLNGNTTGTKRVLALDLPDSYSLSKSYSP